MFSGRVVVTLYIHIFQEMFFILIVCNNLSVVLGKTLQKMFPVLSVLYFSEIPQVLLCPDVSKI